MANDAPTTMTTLLTRILTDIQQVWADPTADPQKTAVLLATGVITLLTLLVLVVLIVTWGPRRPRGERRRARNRRRTRLFRLGISLCLLGALLALDEFATATSTCQRCHEVAPSVATWEQSTHTGVDCLSCHGDNGVIGYVTTRARALGNVVAHVRSGQMSASTRVFNSACLSCHEDIKEGVADRGAIAVRHSDILDGGGVCLDCHGNPGHQTPGADVARPTMDKCLGCHDSQTASAECTVCHLTEVGELKRVPTDYPKVRMAERQTCEGCHSLDKCRSCHRIEMPHPEGFSTGEMHAPLAAFDGKRQLCYRCHEEVFCRQCHGSGFDAHSPDWKREHQLVPRASADSCLNCHKVTKGTWCDVCHER